MATVTGLTAERMLEIEAQSIVDGEVVGDNLILTRFDDGTIDAGSVRGPTGSPGISSGELADEMEDAFLLNAPIGSILEYIEATPPNSLWLMMTGQTITDGQTLYPLLWAKLPASMKSGSNIVMPNTKGRVTVGLDPADATFDTIGETGGAKTHTLITAEMPNHQHTGNTGNESGSHAHGVATVSVVAAGNHVHNYWDPTNGVPMLQPDVGTAYGAVRSPQSSETVVAGSHVHTLSGATEGRDFTHTHAFTTAATGGGGAHNNLQPFVVFAKMIKAA